MENDIELEYLKEFERDMLMTSLIDYDEVIYDMPSQNKFNNKFKERIIKSYSAKFKLFRSTYGFNICAFHQSTKKAICPNNYSEIMENCFADSYNIPAIYTHDLILFITVPEPIDINFNLKKATKFKLTRKIDDITLVEFVYAIRVPKNMANKIDCLLTNRIIALQPCFRQPYILDAPTYYEQASSVKIQNTITLDINLLSVLIEMSAKIGEFNHTLYGNLSYFSLINEPDFSQYRISKTILKNLSILEHISDDFLHTLSCEKQDLVNNYFIQYTGLGDLSVNERRIFEAVLVFISNSQIVYSTEVPTTPKKFKINKKIFLKDIILDSHLKNAESTEKIMERLARRIFLLPHTHRDTSWKTCTITGLFSVETNEDNYTFIVPSFILQEILAIKESAFYVERQTGFYNQISGKSALSTYVLLDYFDYIRHQPAKETTIPVKASLITLLQKMNLYKNTNQGYSYLYKQFSNALHTAFELGFIEDFNIDFNTFVEKVKNKDTSSLGILVIVKTKCNDSENGHLEELEEKSSGF